MFLLASQFIQTYENNLTLFARSTMWKLNGIRMTQEECYGLKLSYKDTAGHIY